MESTWFELFRLPGDSSPVLHIEHDGASHEGYEHVQRIPGVDLNSGITEDTASRHEYLEVSGDTCVGHNQQLGFLTFPEGEVDAVTITASDVEGLQPMRVLSNNIIDFYLKYLERRLSLEERKRFYFFNSFFFTKLLGENSRSPDIDEFEVNYDQVRKWTGEVNLFEKDYIIIPVVKRKICILHLDPCEGMHECFEELVRSYLFQACNERYQASSKREQMLLALACGMKYVQAQVPRQDNGYDCGIYVLHYVELFLRESTSPGFSFTSTKGISHFTSPHFAAEVSAKRTVIRNLICELRNNLEEQAARNMNIRPKPQPRALNDVHIPRPQPKRLSKHLMGQNKISKKWNELETSLLLNSLQEGGRIRKGTAGPSHWDLISQHIQINLGTLRSAKDCQRRYDTLLKAYKRVKNTGKPFCDITDAERRGMSSVTPLTEEWYNIIDQQSSDNAKSFKRIKHNPSASMVSSWTRNPSPPLILSGSSEPEKPSQKQVAIPGFSTLDEALKLTLLFMIHASSMKYWLERNRCFDDPAIFDLEVLCQWLAIVQDRKLSDIHIFVIKLLELKLLNIECKVFIRRHEMKDDMVSKERPCLNLSHLRVYKKFLGKVLSKNPDFDTYLGISYNYGFVSFPEESPSLSPPLQRLQRIRVLSLYKCLELEHANLSFFPELRSLAIQSCGQLKAITGWDVVKELGWLEIFDCRAYRDFPCVQCLPVLKELCLGSHESLALQITLVPDFSQCIYLRRLEILKFDFSAANDMKLTSLRFLEVFTFVRCNVLTTIQSLSGLYSLTQLDLRGCDALRSLPELVYFKALTHLDLGFSGVEEIPGLQELRLLTTLILRRCQSLKTIPWLGHLKALAHLDISESGVEEIPGVEDLLSLEILCCRESRLKGLPDLHHLPRLSRVEVSSTPFSFSFGKRSLCYNSKEERKGFIDSISDFSDTEDSHSDDDYYFWSF